MRKLLLSLFAWLALAGSAQHAPYNYVAEAPGIVSTENGQPHEGFLWIAPGTERVEALMFAFQNMNEETLFSMPAFRERMGAAGVALLWIAPGFGQEWDVNQGVQDAFDGLLRNLAEASGHAELTEVPLIPFGHSAQATMPWNFAAWNPSRTLCLISYHGDAPRSNLCGYGRSNVEWGRTRNIDGIPGLMVMGEYEWWEARLRPALAFRMMYPGSCISFLGDAGRGHFDVSDRTADYIALFVEKAMTARGKELRRLDPADGWLAQTWSPEQRYNSRCKPAPAAEYDGCRHEAFWYIDGEMARMAEDRYAETDGKSPRYLAFEYNGTPVAFNAKGHCKNVVEVTPDADDCFTIGVFECDSTRSIRLGQAKGAEIRYVCGPAVALGNGVFRIDRSHPTWRNPRRLGSITLAAEWPGDDTHKETVQEIEVRLEGI